MADAVIAKRDRHGGKTPTESARASVKLNFKSGLPQGASGLILNGPEWARQ